MSSDNRGSTAGIIFDVQKYSIHDGPGIRTTVFFKGCPLHCLWCHNPEGQAARSEIMRFPDRCIGCGACRAACPTGLAAGECRHCGACAVACPTGARKLAGRAVTTAEVLKEIEKDTVFYDQSGGGVTFSGGEPLMQPEFLLALLQACARREIHTAIETAGLGRAEDVAAAAKYAGLWLYDLKLMDDAKHRECTGASNRVILNNLRLLASSGAPVIVRIPIVPGINDDEGNLSATGEFIAGLRAVREVHVLPYHGFGMDKYDRLGLDYHLSETHEPSADEMSQIAARLSEHGLQVKIGG